MRKFRITTFQGMVLLLTVMVAMVAFTGSYFFYYITITLILTILFMYFLIINNSKKIFQFLKLNTQEIEAGEKIKIEVTSTNTSFFPIAYAKINCMVYNDNYDISLPSENVFFNPFQIVNIKEEFPIETRGLFTNSIVFTEMADPLRLFSRKIKYERPLHLMVYPKVHDLSYFYLPTTGNLGTKRVVRAGHEDYSNIKKVRPYNSGDSMKRIHWKLSSKRGEMFVKEYESTSSPKMNVFLDAYQGHYTMDSNREIEDCAVEVAASVIKFGLTHNTETSVIFHTKQSVQINNRDLSTFPSVLKEFVTFVPKGELAFSELLNQETKRLESGAYVVLITPEVNQGLIKSIIGFKKRLFTVTAIIVNHKDHYQYDVLKGLDVHLYHIRPGDDIKSKLEAFK